MPPLLAVKFAFVPPLASFKTPVKVKVELVPDVVKPVVPPEIVTTPVVGVIEPESPFIDVIAPSAVIACQDGGAPELAVNTKPGVTLLASHEGTPLLEVINTPSFAVAKAAIVFAADAYKSVLIALVAGYVEVDQDGVAAFPDNNSWLAVEVPARMSSFVESDHTIPPALAVNEWFVPPLARLRVPVIDSVCDVPDVVNPVEPPDIVTTPARAVALPASPSMVVILPELDTDCQVAFPEESEVKTNPVEADPRLIVSEPLLTPVPPEWPLRGIEVRVNPPKVGVLPSAISCGKLKVTFPVGEDAIT